jgi:hypothetical protein
MSQRDSEIAPRLSRVYEALLSGRTSQISINASPPNSRTRVLCMTYWLMAVSLRP